MYLLWVVIAAGPIDPHNPKKSYMSDFMPAITTITTTAAGLLVWVIQENRKTKALEAQKEGVLETAMLVLIRNQLVTAHKLAIDSWSITISQKQSFVEMHDLYIKLGGNGPASRLLDDLNRVKLVTD